VDINSAKQKLDHVIKRSRVEMYKPIQVAEVLARARTSNEVNLAQVETYRVKSRQWRDEVTLGLFNKVSTSTMRFQDDLWNESAVPPPAMIALGKANSANKTVEAYIYRFVADKNKDLAGARATLSRLKTSQELKEVLKAFSSSKLTSSADRLFEILATAVFKCELSQSGYTIQVDRTLRKDPKKSVDSLVDLVSSGPMPLEVGRLGHTNAADGGLDIWTNFGVAVSVKRRILTTDLLEQILQDTTVGALHIVCLGVEPQAESMLKRLKSQGQSISVSSIDLLLGSVQHLLAIESSRHEFIADLIGSFDREFPMAQTLSEFLDSRGYPEVGLTGIWRTK
jgi:type II restriction enzyme